MSEFPLSPVSSIAKILLGGTPSRSVPEYWNGAIKWASAKDVAGNGSRYITETEETITELGVTKSAAKVLDPGTIVITARGTVGAMAILSEKMAFNQTCYGLIANEKTDPLFLYYALKASLEQLDSLSYGTVFDTITMKTFDVLVIPLPPLPTQRRIAQILGRLDDKIEVNRRINRTLEAMAQALYCHHFIDFGPYQAGDFIDSELGSIPKGWEVGKLGDYIQATKGLSYKGKYLSDEGMPLHNLNSVYEGGGYKYEGIKFYKGDDFKERHLISPGDLIVANTEQGFDYLLIGCPAIVPKRFGEVGLFTHHIYKIDFLKHSPLTPHWLYFWLKNDSLRQAVVAFTNGTTVNMLARDGLQYPQLVVPPQEIVQRFDNFARSVMGRIEQNEEETRKLAEIRDYLLPRLLSGEIDVEGQE